MKGVRMIDTRLQLGDPIEHRGIVIAPLFPRVDPKADYITLEEALPLGFRITEVDAAGSVPELLAVNPLDKPVLLYDGEELLGAKQNRILNVTVLVPAESETRIPVSCVEQGRWHARSAGFASARHAAHPHLRRRKAQRLSAEPLARGEEQLCLDYLSRPAAFARLYPKLLDGYLLDGLEQLDGKPASQEALADFVSTLAGLP